MGGNGLGAWPGKPFLLAAGVLRIGGQPPARTVEIELGGGVLELLRRSAQR